MLLTGTPASINEITSNQAVRLSSEKSLFHLTKENGLRNGTVKYDPHFLNIHPLGVDVKGEIFGSESKEYREQILKMGSLLA